MEGCSSSRSQACNFIPLYQSLASQAHSSEAQNAVRVYAKQSLGSNLISNEVKSVTRPHSAIPDRTHGIGYRST
jgi:hypothetical protein